MAAAKLAPTINAAERNNRINSWKVIFSGRTLISPSLFGKEAIEVFGGQLDLFQPAVHFS
jgi:hypothetical protein